MCPLVDLGRSLNNQGLMATFDDSCGLRTDAEKPVDTLTVGEKNKSIVSFSPRALSLNFWSCALTRFRDTVSILSANCQCVHRFPAFVRIPATTIECGY